MRRTILGSNSHDGHLIHNRRESSQDRAVIDLKKRKALWEDVQDVLVSRWRRNEKRIPLEKVKADLVGRGKLRA